MTKKKVFAQVKVVVAGFESAETELERLVAARTLRQLAEQLERDMVGEARAAGVRWIDIGQLYGRSKQSVQQRFSVRPASADDA